MKRGIATLVAAVFLICGCESKPRELPLDLGGPTAEWPEYGGDKGAMR